MHEVFTNLLVSCPNGGGLFLLQQGAAYKLDGLDTTGFDVDGRLMLRAFQPALLAQFEEGKCRGAELTAGFDDIHDVLLDGEFRYIVKTQTNEIVKLDQQGREKQLWRFPGEDDSWHINCLARWNGRIVFSAFGDFRLHKEYKKNSRESGFVQDLDTGEKLITALSQPHSLLVADGKLLLADSENFAISEYDSQGRLLRSKKLDGYTRGMLVHGNILYVGLSRSRNTGNAPIARAVVVALDAESWEEIDRHPLSVNEIYSIQHVGNAEMPEILAKLASCSSQILSNRITEHEHGIARLQEELAVSHQQAQQLRQEVSEKDGLIREKEARINESEQVIRENERKIFGLLETVHGKDVHIQSREEIIRAKDLEIQARQEATRERERELASLAQENERKIFGLLETVHGKDIHIHNREEVIRSKDTEVKLRDELIRKLEESLVEARADLLACDRQLGEFRSGLAELERLRRDRDRLNGELGRRDEAIEKLEAELAVRDSDALSLREEARSLKEEVHMLRQEAHGFSTQVAKLSSEVKAKEEQIDDMNRESDRAYSVMQALRRRLRGSEARIADMESSRSWRITRPMRAIKLALLSRGKGKAGENRDQIQHIQAEQVATLQNLESENPPDSADTKPTADSSAGGSIADHTPVPIKPAFDLRGGDSPVVILTTKHCIYVGEEIAAALRHVGIRSRIIHAMPEGGYDDVAHFVICPQMFEQLPGMYVSFQMEQSVSSRWFTEDYVRKLENSFAIFDYSLTNIAKLQKMGLYAQQIYHVPIGYLENYGPDRSADESADYDVIFYGDIENARRRKFISELNKVCKVKVINDLFGDALHRELARAKMVVNIHYYPNALLETTRLWECLSLGKLVVSERSSDMDQHDNLVDLVDFVDVDDVAAMVDRVSYWLADERARHQRLEQNQKVLSKRPNQFKLHFYRFLLATDNITFDEFWKLAGHQMELPGDKICLSLPEFVRRAQSFDRDNHFGFTRFNGLRHSQGWVGCAMSYKLMIMLARQQGLSSVTICEDDVEFPSNFEARWSSIQKHLHTSPEDWDVFSGLMADLHKDAKILRVYHQDGVQFAVTDRLISMVFNVYSSRMFDLIASWDETNRDSSGNTIDRYLERFGALNILTTHPFLVGHKEELHSTLWGFQNTQYNTLIEDSHGLLARKLDSHGEAGA